MSDSEVWKDIVGYEGLYKVSNKGNVYSVERMDSRGNKCGGRTLRPTYNTDGYLQVGLHKNGKQKTKTIHRLVLEAFVPNLNNCPEVNHRDENKTNNYVENLEWCTREYNMNYGTARQRWAATKSIPIKGVHKETGEQIYLKSMAEGTLYGFTPRRISDVCSGKQNTHRGYLFQKIEKGE